MANIKSQIKRNKTNEKARERNKAVKSELRTAILERFRAEEIPLSGPAAAEVPIKISPESAEIITALFDQATQKVRPSATRRRGKPAAGEEPES